jgi:hypothetical protein
MTRGVVMIDRQDLRELWGLLLMIAPAPIGALIGLRYAKQMTRGEQTINYVCSTFTGALAGQVVAERYGLGLVEVALLTVVLTSVSMEMLAGFYGLARAFAGDPLGLLGKALDLWRGRNGGPS